MNNLILVTKEQLHEIVTIAVREAIGDRPTVTVSPEQPIKGIHQLAKFLGISPVTAQKLKNNGSLPYWQSGRLVLFDPVTVRKAMQGI